MGSILDKMTAPPKLLLAGVIEIDDLGMIVKAIGNVALVLSVVGINFEMPPDFIALCSFITFPLSLATFMAVRIELTRRRVGR